MNRFIELIEAIRLRALVDEDLTQLMSEIDALDDGRQSDADWSMTLPYSSDPQPIEDAWQS